MGNSNTYTGALIEATKFTKFRTKILSKAPLYPRFIEEGHEGVTYIATRIRILRNGTYYIVPFIESAILGPTVTKLHLYNNLHRNVYLTKEMFVVEHCLVEIEIDASQEPESNRLSKLKF